MKKFILAALLLPVACSAGYGQHSDIEFGYDDFTAPTAVVVESDELTSDGIQIVEGEFEPPLFAGEFAFAENPGFITPADEGLRVNSGDAVSVKFLDASQDSEAGVGYVNFFDATTGELTSVGQVTIRNQGGVESQLDGASVSNSIDTILLSVGSDGDDPSNAADPDENVILGPGEVHNHLVFELGQDAPGAYGLLFQFEVVPADGGETITSAPIWLILNNGLDEDVFEDEAVAAFSSEEEEGHSDIEFGYDDFTNPTTVVVESDELTSDGIQIVEGEFEAPLFAGEFPFAENPGFITPADEGLRVNPGDAVSVKFLNASADSEAGVGYVNFFDATTGELTSVGQVTIRNQGGVESQLDGASVSNSVDTILLSLGSDGDDPSNAADPGENVVLGPGEVHNHLVFELGQDAPGAYGVLFQFEVVPADGGETITSAPIWLILNNGLNEDVFEDQAVAAFSAPFLLGDVNRDGIVNFLDISPFIGVLSAGGDQPEADINGDETVNFLDISPFIRILSGGQ